MKCGNGFRWYSFASRGYYLYLPGYPGVHGTVLLVEDITLSPWLSWCTWYSAASSGYYLYLPDYPGVHGAVLPVEYITCISLAILVYMASMVQCCQ